MASPVAWVDQSRALIADAIAIRGIDTRQGNIVLLAATLWHGETVAVADFDHHAVWLGGSRGRNDKNEQHP